MTSPKHVTELLFAWSDSGRTALDKLIPLIYAELRRLASHYLRLERANHTLQPTALVHEAYSRLIDTRDLRWQNRAHFFGVASQVMRRILVEHAPKHRAVKRGGAEQRVTLNEDVARTELREMNLLDLDDALTRLAALDAQKV